MGSKLGSLNPEMHYVGEKVWGCGLGTFILWDATGPVSM